MATSHRFHGLLKELFHLADDGQVVEDRPKRMITFSVSNPDTFLLIVNQGKLDRLMQAFGSSDFVMTIRPCENVVLEGDVGVTVTITIRQVVFQDTFE